MHSFQGGIILKLTDFRKVANVISVAFVGSVVVFFLFATIAFLTGCDEMAPVTKPIVNEVMGGDEPAEPTTNGEVKEPVEPAEEPEEKPEPVAEEPEEEPAEEPADPTEEPVEQEPEEEEPVEPATPEKPEPVTPEESIPTTVGTINPGDFTGQVFTLDEERPLSRPDARKLAGVIVTIVSGPHSGKKFLTDSKGRYVFRDIDGDEIHLLAEKEGFEPKEVIVHRSKPTRLPHADIPAFFEDPQLKPGNILIGHRWPDGIRFLFEETKVIDDLLLCVKKPASQYQGYYGYGVATVFTRNIETALKIVAHEIAHAHQHAMAVADGSPDIFDWEKTAECKAYLAARAKDWKKFGKARYDTRTGYESTLENAAEFCAYFWGIGRWEIGIHSDLKEKAPNRLKWAQEWLGKR